MSRSLYLSMLLWVGCVTPTNTDKSDDSASGDDSGGGGGDETTIYDIQTGAVEADATLTLKGVVVTSEITADGKGFFVEDPDGGEYSGIYVYLQGEFADLQVYRDDEVTLTGTVSEYYDWTEFTVSSVSAIEVTGELTGGVAPEELGDTSGWSADDWEPWESVLVSLPDQTVASEVDSYGEAALSAGISMDNLFFDFSTETGATYTAVVGPMEYNFSEFKIAPRDEDDLQGYTAGEGPEEKSICDIQEGADSNGVSVTLSDVVVTTPLTTNSTGFWVQEPGGGKYCGIYVYIGGLVNDNPDFTVTPGDVMTLTGTVTEYPTDATSDTESVTELSVYDASDIAFADTTADVVATELSPDEMPTTAEGWEPWEGVLITLPDLETTSDESSYGEVETSWGIQLDDAIAYYDLTSGMTFDSVTGVVNYSYGAYELLPRSEDDFVGGSGGTTPESYTIYDLQTGLEDGSIADGSSVSVSNVVTETGMTADGKGFFVQDLGGGEGHCVYVYVGSSGATVSANQRVNIEGKIKDYYGMTELDASAGSVGPGDVDDAPTAVIAELDAVPSDWTPYEGCLLTLNGVDVTSDPNTYGESETSWGVLLDDLFYAGDWADGDSYSSVTGPTYYAHSAWRIEPTSASALVE